MKLVYWTWELCKMLFLPERLQVAASLKLRSLQPFKFPTDLPAPTVDSETRCELERLREYRLDGYLPGLTDANAALVNEALIGVIEVETYSTRFPMAELDGFTSSKSTMGTNRLRASQPNMAAMGRIVDDLRDLKGKKDGEIIDACLAWGELRLERGIQLLTDDWHNRFYWLNSGGSHHMAVLCYELQRQNKDWSPEVEVRKYSLNLTSLARLGNRVSLFVVMRDHDLYGYEQIFEPLPRLLQGEDVRIKLGVAVPSSAIGSAPLGDYQLVAVDHSQAYSSIALKQIGEALVQRKAMRFRDFLLAWQTPKRQLEPDAAHDQAAVS